MVASPDSFPPEVGHFLSFVKQSAECQPAAEEWPNFFRAMLRRSTNAPLEISIPMIEQLG
jgi:hypothetical protein